MPMIDPYIWKCTECDDGSEDKIIRDPRGGGRFVPSARSLGSILGRENRAGGSSAEGRER